MPQLELRHQLPTKRAVSRVAGPDDTKVEFMPPHREGKGTQEQFKSLVGHQPPDVKESEGLAADPRHGWNKYLVFHSRVGQLFAAPAKRCGHLFQGSLGADENPTRPAQMHLPT